MRIQITARGTQLSDEFRKFVERRVDFGLGRFAARIQSITIRLTDINGPRGGVDKSCDVLIDAGLPQAVHVSERQAGLHAAVTLAVQRAARSVQRRLALVRPGGKRPRITDALGLSPEAA